MTGKDVFSTAIPPSNARIGRLAPVLLCALLGTLLAGCSVSKEGVSMSENKWVDNNCTGNGYLKNPDWCATGLHASMGPYTGK